MDDQLIVYCSRDGENYVNGELKELEIRQTEKVALMIAKLTGVSLFKLKVKSVCQRLQYLHSGSAGRCPWPSLPF